MPAQGTGSGTLSLVPILHVNQSADQRRLYYVMERADGQECCLDREEGHEYRPKTLQTELEKKTCFSALEATEIGIKLAAGLQFLHDQGLVHRDINPSNVIYLNGEPCLGDPGLIGAVGDLQSIVGTEGYISPEGPGTPVADVFSLGRLIYSISTGRPASDFPALPCDLPGKSDREKWLELNQVLLKACARIPSSRYQTARQLSTELTNVLKGISLVRRRLIRRQLKVTASIAIAAVLLILPWKQWRKKEAQANLENTKTRQVEELSRKSIVVPSKENNWAGGMSNVLKGFQQERHADWVAEWVLARPGAAAKEMLDLTPHYNALLTQSAVPAKTDWEAGNNYFSGLSPGLLQLKGTWFDARGVIQLTGKIAEERFGQLMPKTVEGIAVNQKFHRMMALCFTSWDSPLEAESGRVVWIYSDGTAHTNSVVSGLNISGSWQAPSKKLSDLPRAELAWIGGNNVAGPWPVCLWKTSFTNPHPGKIIKTMSLQSALADPAPAFIAFTVE